MANVNFKLISLNEGGIGFFGFAVLAIFRSVFRFSQQRTAVFRFWCLLRFAGFPSISIWFSVSGKNTSGFSDLVFVVVFVLPIWFPVSVR